MEIVLYLRTSCSTPLSLMERKNYSIRLCVHGEFVCRQRSVVDYSYIGHPEPDKKSCWHF